MIQINRKVINVTGAAAVTALLLTALPTAGATAIDHKNKNRGATVNVEYAYSPARGVVDRRHYKRPIKVYLHFEGMKKKYRNSGEMRRFTRDVKRDMQYNADRRLVFVRNPRAADRVIRIPKREWKRDFRAYTRSTYGDRHGRYDRNDRYDRHDRYGRYDGYDVRYGRYDRRGDRVLQVAHIALDIAHLLKDERESRERRRH